MKRIAKSISVIFRDSFRSQTIATPLFSTDRQFPCLDQHCAAPIIDADVKASNVRGPHELPEHESAFGDRTAEFQYC